MPKLRKVKNKGDKKKNIDPKNLSIEYVNVEKLKPSPDNPRIHSQDAIDKLVHSIEAFGWTDPILISNDGLIVAGHARMKTAKIAGIKSVPIIRLPLSGADAKLYMVADNKLQELTEWDWPKLGDLLQELDNEKIDLTLSGLDKDEIKNILSGTDNLSGYIIEWEGMPEYISDNQKPYRSIIMHFTNEKFVKQFAKLIQQDITGKTKYLYYPKQKKVKFTDKAYDES